MPRRDAKTNTGIQFVSQLSSLAWLKSSKTRVYSPVACWWYCALSAVSCASTERWSAERASIWSSKNGAVAAWVMARSMIGRAVPCSDMYFSMCVSAWYRQARWLAAKLIPASGVCESALPALVLATGVAGAAGLWQDSGKEQ